jgi:hypothetical protein
MVVAYPGLTQLLNDLKELAPECAKELRETLREVGKGTAEEATRLATDAGYGDKVDFRVYVRSAGLVQVEEAKRKTTGTRPDFGALQVREDLIPARDAKLEGAVRDLEERIERVLRRHGF